MEFEAAARRLAKDQSKLKRRDSAVSAKAKREAEYRKKQQERMRQERERRQRQQDYMQAYMTSCDRALGVKSLSPNGLLLQPTSIYGDGDKIALPPSVLQYLTESNSNTMEASSPWTFRVGVLREGYKFPASPLVQNLQPPDEDDSMNVDDESDSDEEEDAGNDKEPYVDELSHKYVSYTYATVVEFTQEEGHVGLPAPTAAALLVDGVPSTRTKDPAGNSEAMDTTDDHDDDKTPGHHAWGAFDVPDVSVEVTLVKLPKGRTCTLIPTMDAIRNGFHNLKDIKLVLEQSLIRTRATLSVNDIVHTWNRGIKYDLRVDSVKPRDFQAVSCINTDMVVDIGVNEEFEREVERQQKSSPPRETQSTFAPGRGQVLSKPSSPVPEQTKPQPVASSVNLLPEPPQDQTEGVCTVQIRAPDGATGRRRFDVNIAKVQDLFTFASSVMANNMDSSSFQLVTRFPRRVFTSNDDTAHKTLVDAGIGTGQEMFIVERL